MKSGIFAGSVPDGYDVLKPTFWGTFVDQRQSHFKPHQSLFHSEMDDAITGRASTPPICLRVSRHPPNTPGNDNSKSW